MEGFWKSGVGHHYACSEHGLLQTDSRAFIPHLMEQHGMDLDQALEVLHGLMQAKFRPERYIATGETPTLELMASER